MNTDYPIIAYKNLLNAIGDGTGSYAFTVGTENTSSPILNVINGDKVNPAFPVTDISGGLSIVFSLPTAISAQVFIMGADRHAVAGFKEASGSFTLDYWDGIAWQSLIALTALSLENTSTIYKLSAHTLGLSGAVYQYRLTYSSLPILSAVSIPELYLGTVLEMAPVDYGYDEYNEIYKGSKFQATSGRLYKTLHYRRLEVSPKWSVLERAVYDIAINDFREIALETLQSFWWAWMPDTQPNACYLVSHDADKTAFPIVSSVHRSLSLKLVEEI